MDQFRRGATNAADVRTAPAILELNVDTSDPTKVSQPIDKRRDVFLPFGVLGRCHKYTNAPNSIYLCMCHKWRCGDHSAKRECEFSSPGINYHSLRSIDSGSFAAAGINTPASRTRPLG